MSETKQRYRDGYWDDRGEYLSRSWVVGHNEDYVEFLVRKVWRLERPCSVVEFGCGVGRFGMMLMGLAPAGSTYAGFDQSAALIDRARKDWVDGPYEAEFTTGVVHEAPFEDDRFDVAVCHNVLMHVSEPEKGLAEMMRVTRDGGLIITCDANRNAHSAIFHIAELDTQDDVGSELIQTANREIRARTGVDHNLGVKTPVLMHKAGLKNVQARPSIFCFRRWIRLRNADCLRAFASRATTLEK